MFFLVCFFGGVGFRGFWGFCLVAVFGFFLCFVLIFNLGNSRSSGLHLIHSFTSYIQFFLPL